MRNLSRTFRARHLHRAMCAFPCYNAACNAYYHTIYQKDTLNINLEHLLGIEGLDLESMEVRKPCGYSLLLSQRRPFIAQED